MQSVRGILLDIDGVLHVSMQPIPGSAETLLWLEQKGYGVSFVSNTTTMAHATLAQRLQQIGLPVEEHQMITAPLAAARYIKQHWPGKRCWLLSKGDAFRDFVDIELVEADADIVILGGAEELLTYKTMNAAFRMLMNGAVLLALHTNKYWKTKDGLQLDSGPYVHALEVATGQKALVIGKPERAFFEQALAATGFTAQETIMVGDDLENDIKGAQKAGLRGIFVGTGKHDMNSPLLQHIQPDAILASLVDLPSWLEHNL
ncbi:TIGR01458 family HAD-type hydrolase [Dictyobacter arantiisoli]|uniref:Haloacid dehalogenase-like hydrolase domain-containing protein 2 n=1 Tax=Dictyobacter arantiisoli TaxID=2014874 RepID=A0A5A5TJC8_9CHLR|nr:TIGR01458 family HAD-type hydrolase [Dictyobacter arantiisoli]GCF11537.1 haloacid dehalogenase [Dictyobacter arantiisoli]